MKYILLLIFAGNPYNGMSIEFDSMRACQDAKTIVASVAGGRGNSADRVVAAAFCFPNQ